MSEQIVAFTKMHGLGNDFVILEKTNLKSVKLPIQQLAHRNLGIGFDQLLIIEPSKETDFFCEIYNSDGSEAEQCGNGLRCVARYIHENGLHPKKNFTLATKAGIYPVQIHDYQQIRIAMGPPTIVENLIALQLDHSAITLPVSILSVGNPHTVIKVKSLAQIKPALLGLEISQHPHFPHGTNVGFMEIDRPDYIRLVTFERGSGETFACGSNACAAVAAGIANGWLDERVQVEFRYGSLIIEWQGVNTPIYMTGPADKVFTGEFSTQTLSLLTT